jgi:hypothetical protein
MLFGHADQNQSDPLPQAVRDWVVALPAPDETTSAIPIPNSTLIGRDADVERLTAHLADPATRLVTLTGPGGIGKTRLALAVAAEMQQHLTDGALFVDLSAATNAPGRIRSARLSISCGQRNCCSSWTIWSK